MLLDSALITGFASASCTSRQLLFNLDYDHP